MNMEKDTNPKDAIGTAKWRQYAVVPVQVLWEVGVGMLEGALKYGRHNYRGSGVRASVYLDAAKGHLDSFIEGEDIDADSGLSHVTKAICSLFVLRDAMMNDFWTDDRPPKIKNIDGLRDRMGALVKANFERYADKDPHHYSHVEDGAPYEYGEAGKPTPDDAVLELIRSSGMYDKMLAEEHSRRMRARVDELRSVEKSKLGQSELGEPVKRETINPPEMRIGRVYRQIQRKGIPDAVWCVTGREGVNTLAIRADWGADKSPVSLGNLCNFEDVTPQTTISGRTSPHVRDGMMAGPKAGLHDVVGRLADPSWLPDVPLKCLSDDDPSQLIRFGPTHPEYATAIIVEGMSSKQLRAMVVREAEGVHAVLYDGDDIMSDALERRVLVRLQSRGKVWHTVTDSLGANMRMYSRLRGDEWDTVLPDGAKAVIDQTPKGFA